MARIRTIKPQHVEDRSLATISMQAHLLWILSWCFSDDEGVLENDPLLLKSQIFPRRTDVRAEQISQWIGQLVEARYMIPFTYNGVSYLIHRTFKTHQRIDKPQTSKVPSDVIRGLIQERSENAPLCIVKESIVEESNSANAADDFSKNNFPDNNQEEEKRKKVPQKKEKPPLPEIDLPFGDAFKAEWDRWKLYQLMQFRFKYKSTDSQQSAVKALEKMASDNETTAIEIIRQSIEKGWKGLFELKNDSLNGKNFKDTGATSGHSKRLGTKSGGFGLLSQALNQTAGGDAGTN
ncbi:MAG: hypothetical protein ABIP68_02045 [Ferruginibacter sp.]